jgi:hypothetical protein
MTSRAIEALSKCLQHKFSGVAVIDPGNNKFVGHISVSDLRVLYAPPLLLHSVGDNSAHPFMCSGHHSDGFHRLVASSDAVPRTSRLGMFILDRHPL